MNTFALRMLFLKLSVSETIAFRKTKEILYKFFEEEKNIKSVLDLGCGIGEDIFWLASKNKEKKFLGIDFIPERIELAKTFAKNKNFSSCNFHCQDATAFKSTQKFDVVLSSEVIEHLPNINEYLQAIRNSLKKNGFLILSTPNKDHILKKIFWILPFKKEFGESITKENCSCELRGIGKNDKPQHTNTLSFEELKILLQKKDFEILKYERGSFVYGGYWFDNHKKIFFLCQLLDKIIPKNWLSFSWNMVIKARIND